MRVYIVEVGEMMAGKYFDHRIEDVFDREDKAIAFMLNFARTLIKDECCLFGNRLKIMYLTDKLPSFERVKKRKIINLACRSECGDEMEQCITVSEFDVK